ncbi:MAG TPA: hypothetical protein VMC09_07620 [Anaerolineales bacterium]|nr:hypothetical protein [Anaerolineales bacterium]
MDKTVHLTTTELDAGLERIRQAPKDEGSLELIVRRPHEDGRETLESGQLDLDEGLVGDDWKVRAASTNPDDPSPTDDQITLMNSRVIALLARTKDRWALAGDQFYVDLDLSVENIPPGSRLVLGSAVLEVTARPHTGCDKFAARFGTAAVKFVNSPEGKRLRLRGVNTRIVQPGVVRLGDTVKKL